MTLPLSGLKILDFSGHFPAPFATLYMADLGADILKITSITRPDPLSLLPPFVPGTQTSSIHSYLGRNKRSMALNLKDSRAQEIVQKLIGEYDIVIEQFRPGVMAKFGLDYESLKKFNPALIYCSVTGYGQTGPISSKGSHYLNYVALSGMLSYSGKKSSGPSSCGVFIGGLAGGTVNVIIGVLAAVIGRSKTGEGQYIDISITDGSVVALNSIHTAEYLACGSLPDYENNLFNGGSLYDVYQTKDGRYMSYCALESHFFSAFCQAVGRPDLESERNPDEAKKIIAAVFKTKTMKEWSEIFRSVDACVEPVYNIDEALESEQSAERGLVVEVDLPEGGRVKQPALPIIFSTYRPQYRHGGVSADAHTKEVLQKLGYTVEQIEEFANTGLLN